MSEHNKFDDYIKGLFKKDPEVPSELKWEAMDFDLPIEEKKKGTSYRRYLLLLLLLLISCSVLYFISTENKEAKIESAQSVSKGFSNDVLSNSSDANSIENNIQNNIDSNDSGKLVPDASSNLAIKKPSNILKKPSSTVQSSKNQVAKTPAKASDINHINNKDQLAIPKLENKIQSIEKRLNTIEDKLENQIQISKSTSTTTDKKGSTTQTSFQVVKPLPGIALKAIPSDFKKEITLAFIPSLTNKEKKLSHNKLSFEEVFISYGYNNFNLNTDDTNILNDKIDNILSPSYRVGINLHINNKWKTNLMLRFDRYHSTFEHTENLEPIIDLQSLRRTNRKEEVFHNNYTNTIGMQLGLERRIFLSKKFYLFAGAGITPTYIINSSGKTTSENIVNPLSLNSNSKRFAINTDLNTGMMFSINNAINLGFVYHYNKFFLNDIFINEAINTNQQHSLSLILAYRLKAKNK